MNTDIIIIRPQQRLAVSPVTAWAIVRERTGKRPLVLARICGNGELLPPSGGHHRGHGHAPNS